LLLLLLLQRERREAEELARATELSLAAAAAADSSSGSGAAQLDAAAIAAAVLADYRWDCDKCTFSNALSNKFCEICSEGHQPTGAAAAAADAAADAVAIAERAAAAAAAAESAAAAAAVAAAAEAAAADADAAAGADTAAASDTVDCDDGELWTAADDTEHTVTTPTKNSAEQEGNGSGRIPRAELLKARYQLTGVVHHIGRTAFYGHYVMNVRNPSKSSGSSSSSSSSSGGGSSSSSSSSSSSGDCWRQYDDSIVRDISSSKALQGDAQQSCYLAFYTVC
jgi:Ubiquitin carboxyl-terminal hydrolase